MQIPYEVSNRPDTGLYNAKVGIWLFLASEVMLFGGLFSSYVFLRLGADYPWPFHELVVWPGFLNTMVLIASSVTVVAAWASLKARRYGWYQFNMIVTLACAVIFMGLKSYEYSLKFSHYSLKFTDGSVIAGHPLPVGGHNHSDRIVYKATDISINFERSNLEFLDNLWTWNEKDGYVKADSTEIKVKTPDKKDKTGKVVTPGEVITLNKEWFHKQHAAYWEALHEKSARMTAYELDKPRINPGPKGDNAETAAAKDEKIKALSAARGKYEEEWLAEMTAKDLSPSLMLYYGLETWTDAKGEKFEASFLDLVEAVTLKLESGDLKSIPLHELSEASRSRAEALAAGGAPVLETWKTTGGEIKATFVKLEEAKVELRTPGAIQDSKPVPGKSLSIPLKELSAEGQAHAKELAKGGGPLVFLVKEKNTAGYGTDKLNFREGTVIGGKLVTDDIQFNVDIIDLRQMGGMDKHEKSLVWKYLPELKGDFIKYRADQIEKFHERRSKVKEPEKDEDCQRDAFRVEFARNEGFMDSETADHYLHKEEHTILVKRSEKRYYSNFSPSLSPYYAIYFLMTGLHGLHVIGGAIVLGWFLLTGRKMYRRNPEHLANRVEVGGLFWHFVDLVWIFLFPLYYLM